VAWDGLNVSRGLASVCSSELQRLALHLFRLAVDEVEGRRVGNKGMGLQVIGCHNGRKRYRCRVGGERERRSDGVVRGYEG
jgi:hypothetical protein